MILGSCCTPAYLLFKLTVVRKHLSVLVAYSWMLLLLTGAYLSLVIPYFANLLNWQKIIYPVFIGLQICIPDLLYKTDDHGLKKGANLLLVVSTVALDLLVCQLPFSNSSEPTKILTQTGKDAGLSFSRNSLLSPLQLTGNFWFVDLDGIWRGPHRMYFWHNECNLRREN